MFFTKACFLLALTVTSYASLNPKNAGFTYQGNDSALEKYISNPKTGGLKPKHCYGEHHLKGQGLHSTENNHSSRNKSKSKISLVPSVCSINPSSQKLNTDEDIKTTRKIKSSEYHPVTTKKATNRRKTKNEDLNTKNSKRVMSLSRENQLLSRKNKSLSKTIKDLENEHLNKQSDYENELQKQKQNIKKLHNRFSAINQNAQNAYDKIKGKVECLSAENKALTEEMKKIYTEKSECVVAYQGLQAEYNNKETELKNAQNNAICLAKKNKRLKTELKKSTKSLTAPQNLLCKHKARKMYEDLQERLEKITEFFKRVNNNSQENLLHESFSLTYSQSHEETKEKKPQGVSVECQTSYCEKEAEKLSHDLAEATKRIEWLESKIKTTNQSASILSQELCSAKQLIVKIHYALEKHTQAKAELEKEGISMTDIQAYTWYEQNKIPTKQIKKKP